MKKSFDNIMCAAVASALTAAIASVLSSLYMKKELTKKIEDDKTRLKKSLSDSEKILNNIPDQVDKAVRFVYDNEARNAFDRRLKTINIEDLATTECQKTIKKIEDPVLRKAIRDSYYSQVYSIMNDEIKKYFKEGIKKIVESEVDADYIRRTARNCVQDYANNTLESEVERKMSRVDAEEALESYIEDNSSKYDSLIRKTLVKVLYDKFDDDFVDKIKDAVVEAANAD